MIIELILQAIYNLFNILTAPINIPNFPDQIHTYLNYVMSYITMGAGILNQYAPMNYILSLFVILLAIDVGLALYHFVMWVLKKIPMLGVS